MKPVYKNIVEIIILAGALTISLLHRPAPDNHKLNEEIARRKQSEVREDSIRFHMEQLEDQLEIVNLLLINSKRDAEIARAETNKANQRYAKIPYVKHPNDSSRLRELSGLFPAIH